MARAARSRLSMSVYCLVTSRLPSRSLLEFARLGQLAAEIEDEFVEDCGGHAHDDRAP